MANPTAAMLVIGDEILSGRTRDSNLHHLAQELTRAGIDLREARIVSDDHAGIVAAVQEAHSGRQSAQTWQFATEAQLAAVRKETGHETV